jgi:hypothetical protein
MEGMIDEMLSRQDQNEMTPNPNTLKVSGTAASPTACAARHL